MKKIDNILYFTDGAIYLKNRKKDEIIKYKISKNIINNGRISNINKFIKVYENMLNNKKINNSLFGETIKIIVHPLYTNADITLLKNIFETFNYRKVFVENETKYYKLNSTNAYLNIRDNYGTISYINEYKELISLLIPENFFLTKNDLMEYLSKRLIDKEVYMIGNGELFQEIFNRFEDIFHIKTYMFTDNEYYILNSALK